MYRSYVLQRLERASFPVTLAGAISSFRFALTWVIITQYLSYLGTAAKVWHFWNHPVTLWYPVDSWRCPSTWHWAVPDISSSYKLPNFFRSVTTQDYYQLPAYLRDLNLIILRWLSLERWSWRGHCLLLP